MKGRWKTYSNRLEEGARSPTNDDRAHGIGGVGGGRVGRCVRVLGEMGVVNGDSRGAGREEDGDNGGDVHFLVEVLGGSRVGWSVSTYYVL
jgi:hypothetical protein